MKPQKYLLLTPCVLLLIWLITFCLLTGRQIANAYNTLPEMDAWEKVVHLDGYLHFPPAVLWEQHYEHRVVFPEMVLAFDWLVLRGREIFPMALNCVLDISVWCLFLMALRQSPVSKSQEGSALQWCSLFLAGIVMAWPGVAFVLSLPFLLQWLMYQFCATASLYALAKLRVAWAILFAVVATYSSANGVFVWPVLLLFALYLKLGWRQLLKVAAIGAVSVALFFIHYRNLGNSHPGLLFSKTAKFVGYYLTYLGMPFGAIGKYSGLSPAMTGTVTGLVAGVASLILCAFLAFSAWRRRRLDQPVAVVGFGICLLTLMTAFVTSASRIPVDRPFAQAIITPGRYVNTAAHYWAALIILSIWTAAQWRPKAGWLTLLGLGCLCAVTLTQTDYWIREWMNQYASYQYATLAIEAGLKTNEMAQILNYADAGIVQRALPVLESRHLALYSWDRYKLVGQPVSAADSINDLPRQFVTDIQPVQGGFRIIGWAKPHPEHLVVASAAGTIIGLGMRLPAGLPIGTPAPAGHEEDAWIAFAGKSFRPDQARYIRVK